MAHAASAPVIMGGPGSGLEPTMKKVFFFTVLALHALMVLLLRERYRLEKATRRISRSAAGSGGGMKNLNSIFAAYMMGWGVFFVFYLSVAKRTSALRGEKSSG